MRHCCNFFSAEATMSFVVAVMSFFRIWHFVFSNMFICVFDVSRARGYIYNLVPRVLRLLYLLVSPFLTSQYVTLKLSTSIVPKNKARTARPGIISSVLSKRQPGGMRTAAPPEIPPLSVGRPAVCATCSPGILWCSVSGVSLCHRVSLQGDRPRAQ